MNDVWTDPSVKEDGKETAGVRISTCSDTPDL